jgi:hypothetical protein
MSIRLLHRRPRAVVALLLLASCVRAATASAAPGDGDETDLRASILEEERDTELRVVGLGRLRVRHPQRLSVGAGAMLARQPRSYDCTTVCEFQGLYLLAEPGYSGGRLSVGFGRLKAEKRRNERFLSRVYLGWGVKAALLRTWNGADLNPPDQTLLGVEADLAVIGLGFELGVFRRVGGGDAGDPWVISGGFGWGF